MGITPPLYHKCSDDRLADGTTSCVEGYFPVGDAQALADLLFRAETDSNFYEALKTWCTALRPLTDPARERESWARLLRDMSVTEREIPAGT